MPREARWGKKWVPLGSMKPMEGIRDGALGGVWGKVWGIGLRRKRRAKIERCGLGKIL